MGMGLSVVSEGHFDSLRINHPTPCTIVQPVAGGDVLWYVVYRFLMAIYIVGSFVNCIVATHNDMKDNFAFLHFPVWGYIAANIQAVLLAICTLANYQYVYKTMSDPAPKHRRSTRRSHRGKKTTFSVSVPKMPQAYVIIWVTYYIMLYSSLMTLLMYETGLFRGRLLDVVPNYQTPTPNQVMLHQVFFAYCLLDFCVCGIPVRIMHVHVMTAFAIVYQLTLLVVTIAFSRTVENYRPLYYVADFQPHRLTLCSVNFVGFAFITPIAVHIIYYGLFLLKSQLLELYLRARVNKRPNYKAADTTGVQHEAKGVAGERAPGRLRPPKIMPISEQGEEDETNKTNIEREASNYIMLTSSRISTQQ